MANTRISNLTASASNLASTDLAPVVQTVGVGPVKMTGLQLAGGLLGSTTFNGSTVTTSSPVLNLTQTWNAGAVTFTGLKFNATDTASASGSLLLDLQVGGTSKIAVRKDGLILNYKNSTDYTFNSPAATIYGYLNNLGRSTTVIFDDGSGNGTGAAFWLGANGVLKWQNVNRTDGGSTDLYLSRGGVATLQLGAADAAAPVAQTFKVQSVAAGTSNTAGANFTIQGSQGTGTGAGGSIIFQVAPAGSSGTAQNAYSTALTIDSTRRATFAGDIYIWPSQTYISNAGSQYYFSVSVAGGFAFRASNISFEVNDSYRMGFVSDTFLWRDTTNTLALRNGGTSGTPVPQTFRVYNWTDGTNSEYVKIGWSANSCTIATEKSGTGASRALLLVSAGQTNLTPLGDLYFGAGGNPQWVVASGGALAGNLITYVDSLYDIGKPTESRPRNIYAAGGYSAASPAIKTANYTQALTDYSLIFNGSGSITLTLLAAATYPGKILYVKTIAAQTVVSASSNVKPIDTDTAGTAILAATAGKWAMLQSDGTNWVIMAQG